MVKSVYVPEAGGIIDFPDEASPQQMLAYIQNTYGVGGEQAPAPQPQDDGSGNGGGILGNAAYDFATGITSIPGGIASLVMPAKEAEQSTLGQISSSAEKYLQGVLGIDPTKERSTPEMLAGAVGSLGSFLLPGLGATKLAGLAGLGLRAARGVGTAAVAATGAAQGAQQRSERIRNQLDSGMEIPETDQMLAQLGSAAIGTLEVVSAERFLKPLSIILSKVPASQAALVEKIIENRFSKVLTSGAIEGGQEATSGVLNDLMEAGVYNPDVPIGQDFLSNAGGGAFVGSLMEGILQAAAGRKLRGARQLQTDLAQERVQNSAQLRSGRIAQAADALRSKAIDGPVTLEEGEFDGLTMFNLKTPDGSVVGSYGTEEDATAVVDTYNKMTGAKAYIRTPAKAPGAFPVKINGKKYHTIDEVEKARDAMALDRADTARYSTDADLLKSKAAEKGVSEEFYKGIVDDTVFKIDERIKKFDEFLKAAKPKSKLPSDIDTTEETPAEEGPKAKSVVPTREIVAEEEAIDEPVTEEVTDEAPAPEAPVDERVYTEEEPTTPIGETAPGLPGRTEMRPTATDAQLTALKTELFGKPLGYREMTPEQLSAYEAERDKRFPPAPVTVYYDAAPTGVATETATPIGPTAPAARDYTPEYAAEMKSIAEGLEARARNIVPNDVSVSLKTFIDRGPGYLIRGEEDADPVAGATARTINLATGIWRPNMSVEAALSELTKVLNHEAIHSLRAKGLFRPAEWNILSKAVANAKVPGKKYTYLDKARAIYEPMGGAYTNEDAVIEEAVAELYKDWVTNRNAPVQTRGLLNRITEFFRRLFQTLRNNKYKAVFEDIESGVVKSRPETEARMMGPRYAVSPVFLRSSTTYTVETEPGKKRRAIYVADSMDASTAARAFRRLNEAIRKYPDPLKSQNLWTNNLAFAYNQPNDLLFPPGWAMSMVKDIPSWSKWMSGLTPKQLSGVDAGFNAIRAISAQYKAGRATPEFTGTLLFWTYLSRMASSFPHEAGFLDVAEKALPFIKKAVDGTFTADLDLLAMTATGPAAKAMKEEAGLGANSLPADIAVAGRSDLDDWFLMVKATVPSYSPGNSVTNNMNSYGRDFLFNMAGTSPDGTITKLRAVHDLFSSNMSGPEVRRQFHRIRDGVALGFDNKILSFAILLSGRTDVLVLDRIQINQLFGGGQTNKIYDDVQGMFNGPKGLAVYEALERGLTAKVNELYNTLGRPQDASLGRYHWESWIRSSGQIVSHPTIQGLVNMSQGKHNPFADIGVAEGRYHRSTFGVQYMKRPNGKTEYVYTTQNGDEYAVDKADLDNILKKSNLLRSKKIPQWFPGVSDFEGGLVSWRDYPGVDILAIDKEIEAAGIRIGNGRPNQTVTASTLANQSADAARSARARAIHHASNRARFEFGRRPVGGKPHARIPESFTRVVGRPVERDVIAAYELKPGVAKIFEEGGIGRPTFLELQPTAENVKKFRDALIESKNESKHGAAVYVYDESDYAGMRLFLSEDGGTGFALKGNDIVSVFNKRSSPHRGAAIPIIHLAIQLGGRKLDGFDTVLPGLYSQGGMGVISRTKFVDLPNIRPDNWNYDDFAEFNGGRPDVVFMVFHPENWSIYKPTDGQLFTSNKRNPRAAADEAYGMALGAQEAAIYVEPEPIAKEPKKKSTAKLSAAPVERDEAFQKLADGQRFLPEYAMLDVQKAMDGGVISHAAEHLGDLTHRMSEKFSYLEGQQGIVQQKVNSVLRSLTSEYGFEREFEGNIRSSAQFRNVSPDSVREAVYAALDKYAEEHSKLEVYNEPQRLARDAAVALGERNFRQAAYLLAKLKKIADLPEKKYIAAVGEYNPPEGARFSAAPALDSEEFARWFKQSKVVNPDGSPKIQYHGTTKRFGTFKTAASEMGAHFGTPAQANDFVYRPGESRQSVDDWAEDVKFGRTDQIFPVYLSIQNPLRVREMKRWAPGRLLNDPSVADFVSEADRTEFGKISLDEQERRIKFAQDLMKRHGYDGIVYLNRVEGITMPTDPTELTKFHIDVGELSDAEFKAKYPEAQDSYIVFDPEQVKSVFNEFEEGAAESPRFAAAPLPTNIELANRTLFTQPPKQTFWQTMSDFFLGHPTSSKTLTMASGRTINVGGGTRAALSMRTAAVDRNAFVEFLEKIRNQELTGNFQLENADDSATAQLAFKDRSSHLTISTVLMGELGVDFARPGDIQSATLTARESPDSLINVFKILLQPGAIDPATGKPGNKLTEFKSYAAALRARNLKAAGKPVPAELTDAYINTIIPHVQNNYPEVVQAYEMYQRVNKKVVTALRDSGRISDAELAALTRDMDYYGFYREVYEEQQVPGITSKTAGKIKLREYQGSDMGNLIGDPMYVMIRNMQFLIDSMSKNLATTKVFNLARDMGEARLLGTSEKPDPTRGEVDEVMFFHQNGVLKRFAVKDKLLVSALGSDDRVDIGRTMHLLGLPTQIIRESVTRDPGFMIANLLRDTVASWITSGEDITPFIGTAKGIVTALKRGTSYQALAGRGAIGSYDMAMKSADEIAAIIKRRETPSNVHAIGTPEGLKKVIGGLWDRMGVLSEASDAATRIAVYEAAKAQGLSDAEATFRAIRILDFSRRGGSQLISLLTKLVPFLNARIQGLDVVYQAGRAGIRYATGRSMGERDANLGKKFLVRGAMLAAISMALEMLNAGDDDYEDLPDYVRNGNLLIPLSLFGMKGEFIAIPKAFEPGLLFSTLPQQLYRTATDKASSRENMNLFTSSYASTFGVNPIPQLLLPLVEIATNHDFYTGMPLISEGKARLAPELQYDARTSSLSMMLGNIPIHYNLDTGRWEGVSPIILEKLISGYSGPLGSIVVTGAGMMMETADIGPERLPKSFSQLPAIRRVFIDAESKSPKGVSDAYELFRIVDEANRTFSRLRQTGDAEATLRYYEDNKDILKYKGYAYKLTESLNALSAYERRIERDPNMSRDEKIEAMSRLRQMRLQLTGQVKAINKDLNR